jgi:ferredoxin
MKINGVAGALILKKSDAGIFLEGLGRDFRIIAPRRHLMGDIMFGAIQCPEEVVWDYGHDLYPPKRFFLPHYENLFRYRYEAGGVELEKVKDAPQQAIIGVRSCDVSAIQFQGGFFGSPTVDPYYKSRLDNTVLFSLVCNEPPRKECFCICCDSGPYLDVGFDVQLTDLGDRFLYQIGSEKGAKATESVELLLTKAEEGDLAERRRIEAHADSRFETIGYLAKAIIFTSENRVPEKLWEELGSTCFRCGACTNLCPVCTCFTVEDRKDADGYFMRCRSWDSCQFSGFTREASGHNPRPTFGSRLLRRFYHKASYQYILRDGRHGCVGCGRCITCCLTDLGVPTVIKRVRRELPEYLEAQQKEKEG